MKNFALKTEYFAISITALRFKEPKISLLMFAVMTENVVIHSPQCALKETLSGLLLANN